MKPDPVFWKFANPVYLFAVIVSVLIYRSLMEYQHAQVEFYGFAENKETDINLDYPVEIVRVLVVPGQFVQKGTPLAEVINARIQQGIEEDNLGIQVLAAKERIGQTEETGRIEALELEKSNRLAAIQQKIDQAKSELAYQTSLWEGLKTIQPTGLSDFHPEKEKIRSLEMEYQQAMASYDQEIKSRKENARIQRGLYFQESARIQSGIRLKEERLQHFQITAPHDGLVGNIKCREGEFFDAFVSLISFYEANPTQVKAFVHENQIIHVDLGDTFQVGSIKDNELRYRGVVIGLGSRIVEIPERMRKIPEIKSYGREVTIELPPDNALLQKEKVRLSILR
ncbi:MAG TPA: hypothetical protein PKE06_06420 [Flavilitoribacter sp.]|nr:hypothetical protein [Flavilitoribacter sp.]HMQ86773.1 hypothetical protein [Flavilitoribacter sp.]